MSLTPFSFSFDTIYNPDNAQLGVTYTGFANKPGGTTNQGSKGTGLDRVPIHPVTGDYNSGNADFDNVLTELANVPAAQLGSTLDSLAAEPYASFLTVLLEQNDFYAETVLERAQLCSARGRGSLAGGYSPQQAAGGEPNTDGCPNHERHGVWLDATWL